jgi:hypothetical protein
MKGTLRVSQCFTHPPLEVTPPSAVASCAGAGKKTALGYQALDRRLIAIHSIRLMKNHAIPLEAMGLELGE